MKKFTHSTRWTAAGLAALAAFALSASAQTGNASAQNALGVVAPANQVYGHEVVSSDNQQVGKLNNLVVDLATGRILYGIVGISGGRVAVPPEIFTQTLPKSNNLNVNVTKQKIDGAPKFDPVDKAGQWGQASFVSQVYQYFGQSPWWQGSAPANQGSFQNVHKASQLYGMKVEGANNQPIGTIKNTLVDLPPGRVGYLILKPDSSLNLGSNLYPMPPEAFTPSANQTGLVSGIDGQKLASAPHFTTGQYPNFDDPTYASQVYQFYGKQPWFSGAGAVQPTGR